ncbi:ferritin-like domain-containing protein [Paractinoplanes hotanensis]|uniref:Ferritin/DPS domain-containing protein n=1 Tax=Paractinoplanes hotanensis TaxID=2906497 RepID=A0ABT0YBL5_9ACTN|nr:ferritin-like domain-containing protein [Actinoplanes hotanensis]MCM4083437.1 hypothetical protein [Actinoplanes hotanensis]
MTGPPGRGRGAPLHRREAHDRALLDLEDGAVTPSNQAELVKLAELMNVLLAGLVVSSLQFEQHAHLVRGASARPLAGFLQDCAARDRAGAWSVAERVHQLGFRSDYDPQHLTARSHVPFRTFEECDLLAVVTQNLVGVRVLVQTLQEAVRWLGDADPTTRRLLERLLEDKEWQADTLSAERTGVPRATTARP